MQPKNPKDIVQQILEQQRLNKADFKGPGMLDQDSFDMPFSLSQEAKNTLNNYYTAAAKQVKNNPEVFTIKNIKEGATLLNSGFASEAQLSKSQLQEELIKALNAEKIEHSLKPIRKKQTTGGLLSDDREKFVLGTLATKVGQLISKKLAPTEIKNLEKLLLDKKYSELGAPTFTKKELNKIKNESDSDAYKDFLREFAAVKQNDYDYIDNAKKLGLSNEGIINLLKKSDKDIKNELKKLDINSERNSLNVGGELQNPEKADLDKDGKLSSYEQARGEAIEESMREQKQEGGMMMDDQMNSMMQKQETPIMENQMADMMPEEKTEEQKAIEKAQAPDEMMEENYVDFLIDEALSDDEEAMLMQELQANPQLSMLFDKVMEVAMEFSGSGPVEGPGTEVSDSIPARLSDGEFVFTAKSVDVLGADNLMSLMKQAEAQADQRQTAQDGGIMEEEDTAMPVQQEPVRQDIRVTKETVDSQAAMQDEEDLVGDEIKKSMLSGRPHVRS